MPIPLLVPPQEEPKPSRTLQLLPTPEPDWIGAPLPPRSMAHALDLMILLGISAYASKFFSLLLVAIHLPEIRGSGRLAGRLFQETLSYGEANMGLATAIFSAMIYFVALPHYSGRTVGMGLLGLKVVDRNGDLPGVRPLVRRLLGCSFVYATGGMMLLPQLKRTPRPLFQDWVSETRVVKSHS